MRLPKRESKHNMMPLRSSLVVAQCRPAQRRFPRKSRKLSLSTSPAPSPLGPQVRRRPPTSPESHHAALCMLPRHFGLRAGCRAPLFRDTEPAGATKQSSRKPFPLIARQTIGPALSATRRPRARHSELLGISRKSSGGTGWGTARRGNRQPRWLPEQALSAKGQDRYPSRPLADDCRPGTQPEGQ